MKKIYIPTKKLAILLLLAGLMSLIKLHAQSVMPMPPYSSSYSTYARGFWFIAPCDFRITGLKVPSDAGPGLQYIHVMKCHDPFPVATTGSTNFTTLTYISGAPNNVVQNVNIQIKQGDTIGILGTAGQANSYTAAGVYTTVINGITVPITRFGYQGDIDIGPAPEYWGETLAGSGAISRIEVHYTTTQAYNNASAVSVVSPVLFPQQGLHDIKLKIANKGGNVINNVNVEWELNGVPQTPFYWSGALDTAGGTGPKDTILTLASAYNFMAGSPYTIKAWTAYPNSIADTVNTDDTVYYTITPKPPMAQAYSPGYNVLAIQDFDSIYAPDLPYTVTTGNLTFVNGSSPGSASPPNSPYGMPNTFAPAGSWSWYQNQQSGGATLTFDNVSVPQGDTIYITYKLAAFAVNGSDGPDAGDYMLASVSTDGGSTWYDQIRVEGASGSTSWPFTATGEASRVFSTSALTTFVAPANTLSNLGYGTVTIKVPNASQVRLRVTLRSSTANERYCVDNIEIKNKAKTYNDASVSALVSPAVPFCAGLHPIDVRVSNMGRNQINGVNINWEMNGVPQTPLYHASVIDTIGGSNPSSAVISLSTGMMITSPNTLKVWTSYPNALADTTNLNDTLNLTIAPAINGTYTIGATNSDYPSFTAAVNDLQARGVCGPVTFDVRTGTYPEQITLGNFIGSSATNMIIFRSMAGHRDSVIVNFSASSAANDYVLKLTDSRHITFRDMTLNATSASYGTVVQLSGTASYNTIENCKLDGIEYGIFADDISGGKNTFRNNLMNNLNATYGIYFYGNATTYTDSNRFENNTIVCDGTYPMYLYYSSNMKVRNNTITGTSSYGIRVYYAYDELEITGNVINKASGTYGMYIYYPQGTATKRGLIANNVISGCNYGIRNYYSIYQRFYNNTIRGGSTAGIYLSYGSGYTNNEWKNNIITSTGGIAFDPVSIAGANNIWDHNLYYSTLGAASTIDGYADLAAWRTATGNDKNSFSMNPVFAAGTHQLNTSDTSSWLMNGAGVQLDVMSTDILGNPRPVIVSAGAPDLGAYEFTPVSLAPRATVIPPTPSAGITQAFLYGTDTIAKITWDQFAPTPAYITARLYQGAFPPGVNVPTQSVMNEYWDFDVPAGFYNYNIKLYYRNALIGSNPLEHHIVGAKLSGTNPWSVYQAPQSQIDTALNVLTINGLNDFSIFTGTDQSNPVPVKLTSFSASAIDKDAEIRWITASEKNASSFIVEFSADGKTFTRCGEVKAKGNSSSPTGYVFIHADARAKTNSNGELFYRLTSIDRNGSKEQSGVVMVQFNNKQLQLENATAYPNPFNTQLTLLVPSETETSLKITISDAGGRKISESTSVLNSGVNQLTLHDMPDLDTGIYLISLETNQGIKTLKVVKH